MERRISTAQRVMDNRIGTNLWQRLRNVDTFNFLKSGVTWIATASKRNQNIEIQESMGKWQVWHSMMYKIKISQMVSKTWPYPRKLPKDTISAEQKRHTMIVILPIVK